VYRRLQRASGCRSFRKHHWTMRCHYIFRSPGVVRLGAGAPLGLEVQAVSSTASATPARASSGAERISVWYLGLRKSSFVAQQTLCPLVLCSFSGTPEPDSDDCAVYRCTHSCETLQNTTGTGPSCQNQAQQHPQSCTTLETLAFCESAGFSHVRKISSAVLWVFWILDFSTLVPFARARSEPSLDTALNNAAAIWPRIQPWSTKIPSHEHLRIPRF
jgi:hypothetical protein